MMAKPKENPFLLPLIPFNQSSTVPAVVTNPEESLNEFNPAVYCRTCANMDSCLVPIFNGEGLDHELNKKIEKYLPIQISQEDDLPGQLCYHCASTIIAWDTLIIGCLEADKKLKALKDSLRIEHKIELKDEDEISAGDCNISDNLDSDDEPLISKKYVNRKGVKRKTGKKREILQEKTDEQKEIKTDINETKRKRQKPPKDETEDEENQSQDSEDSDNEINPSQDCSSDWDVIPQVWLNLISCKYCGKISNASKHLKQHERRKSCVKNYECNYCSQNFTKATTYQKHMKKHDREKLTDTGKRFTCSVCNKKFKFEDNGLAHEKLCGKTRENTFKCSVCGKRFETQILADQHSTSHHKSCVCHLCGQSFNKPESLKQHIKTIHEEFKMVCHYCGKEFTRKARLQEHLQHHTGQMDFTCHVCGKGSTNSYSFSVHLATHTEETPYTCSFCPRSFKHMKYVYLHERAVHLKLKSGKTYVKPKKPGKNFAQRTCPLCNKTFKRESAMLIHKRSVHEGKNGYICKICGKDFKYTYLLYVHKKKHHFPELCKYVCQFCQKPFPVKTELEKHLRKHTGEKPYICNLCGKTYSFHGSLNMHMKTQHENKKNFKCTECDASFNFRSHLTRHMSAHMEKFPVDIQTIQAACT